jgi:hypothetical protein
MTENDLMVALENFENNYVNSINHSDKTFFIQEHDMEED